MRLDDTDFSNRFIKTAVKWNCSLFAGRITAIDVMSVLFEVEQGRQWFQYDDAVQKYLKDGPQGKLSTKITRGK